MTENEIITKEPFELTNKRLITVSKQIKQAEDSTKRNLLKIARLMFEVNQKELYKDDFKNIVEYGEAVHGYKSAFVYQLINVGETCIDEKYQNRFDTVDNHYTLGQMVECLPLIKAGKEDVINKEITPDMPTKKIREKVKEIFGKPTTTKKKKEEEQKSTGELLRLKAQNLIDLILQINILDDNHEDYWDYKGTLVKFNSIITDNENEIMGDIKITTVTKLQN